MEKKRKRKRKKRKNEKAKEKHFGKNSFQASGTKGPEAIYSDGLISFKPDIDQKPVRKEMTKWKEH